MAELRLTAWTHQEHDQKFRDTERDFVAAVFLDQCERKVDARSNSRRRIDIAIFHEDRLGHTIACGNSLARRSQKRQCVNTCLPSISPAAPSRNAPMQMEATRRDRSAAFRIQETNVGSYVPVSAPG